MQVSVEFDRRALGRISGAMELAAEKTMDEVVTEVRNSATMPRETGNLQNGGTYEKTGAAASGNQTETVRESHTIRASLINDAPQARRLYFHPEYSFQKGHNQNAGGRWLDEYLEGGARDDFIPDTFCSFLEEVLKK